MSRKIADYGYPIALFIVIFFIYFGFGIRYIMDSFWTIPTAVSIVREGNTNLDEFDPVATDLKTYRYTLAPDGHYYNRFPLGPSLIAIPFIALVDFLIPIFNQAPLPLMRYTELPILYYLEGWVAAFCVALSAAVIYQIARLSLTVPAALAVVVIYAFCTPVWSTATRSLWQHGPSVLFITLSIYSLLRAQEKPVYVGLAGFFVACAYIMRPTNSIFVGAITLYVLVSHRQYFLRYILCAAPVAIFFTVYNYSIYGAIFSPYFDPNKLTANGVFLEGFLGNIISPGRGLFVFSPVLLLALVGIGLKLRGRQLTLLDGLLLLNVVLHWFTISNFDVWWAGHSYGPRFMTDMIPILMLFFIPIFQHIPAWDKRVRYTFSGLILATSLLSFFIHFQGVNSLQTVAWNSTPIGIDVQPARAWDWHDLQFLRPFQQLPNE